MEDGLHSFTILLLNYDILLITINYIVVQVLPGSVWEEAYNTANPDPMGGGEGGFCLLIL